MKGRAVSEASKGGGVHQEFTAASREVDARQPPVQEQSAGREQGQDEPFLTEQDRHEADREVFTKSLDERVQSGSITSQERYYQLQRFENDLSGDFRKQNLKFFEDKDSDKEHAQESGQQERDQAKGQSDGRTLSFFEDRNKEMDRDR